MSLSIKGCVRWAFGCRCAFECGWCFCDTSMPFNACVVSVPAVTYVSGQRPDPCLQLTSGLRVLPISPPNAVSCLHWSKKETRMTDQASHCWALWSPSSALWANPLLAGPGSDQLETRFGRDPRDLTMLPKDPLSRSLWRAVPQESGSSHYAEIFICSIGEPCTFWIKFTIMMFMNSILLDGSSNSCEICSFYWHKNNELEIYLSKSSSSSFFDRMLAQSLPIKTLPQRLPLCQTLLCDIFACLGCPLFELGRPVEGTNTFCFNHTYRTRELNAFLSSQPD